MFLLTVFLTCFCRNVVLANITEGTFSAELFANITKVTTVTEVINVTEETTRPTTTAIMYNCSEFCLPPPTPPPATVFPLCNGTDIPGTNGSLTLLPCCSEIIYSTDSNSSLCNGSKDDCVNKTLIADICNDDDNICVFENITCNKSNNCVEGIEREIQCSNTSVVSVMEDADSCNRTTGRCLNGCVGKNHTGPFCNLTCLGEHNLNCEQCAYDEENDKAICGVCKPKHFKQAGVCRECSKNCAKPANGTYCDMEDGSCPHGCIDGSYGLMCSHVCHALCKPTNSCEQFTGCCSQKICSDTLFCGCICATYCSKKCLGGTCNRDCTCEKGCEPNGFYGPKCDKKCSENCFTVPDATQTCNDSNGYCLDGCIRLNLWGPMCDNNCSFNCLNNTCDRDSGRCTYGCISQKVHGPDCSLDCNSNCNNSHCDRGSGECTEGCVAGFHGVNCDKVCSPTCLNEECNQSSEMCTLGCVNGLFDKKCDRNCSFNCKNYTCDFLDGKCSLGCRECFIGDYCQEECPSYMWIYVAIGCGAFVIIGIILLMVWGKRKIRYVRKRPFNNGLEIFPPRDKVTDEGDVEDMIHFENPMAIELLAKTHYRIFLEDVLNKDMTTYRDEFKKLISGLDKDETLYKAAKELDNLTKNLYNDVLPYDKNRVVLEVSDGAADDIFKTESDYINASFIDGFDQKQRYIAAQGPSEETVVDFWKMVWQQRTFLVVMMNVIPKSYSQMIKYWPEEGKKIKYGEVSIETQRTKVFADFITRDLKLTKGTDERSIQHLQFLRWPEQGVPPSSVEIIEFHQKFRAMDIIQEERTNPIIVHCTNGIEKTGVFIALDIIVDKVMKSNTSEVDVFKTVNTLREQRVGMVKTIAQYKFLYETAAQKVAFGCALLNKTDIEKEYQRLLEIQIEDGKMAMRKLFESCILSLMLDDNGIPEFDQIQEKGRKNRPTSDIPDARYRVALENVSYINAVFLDTYTRENGIVTTQMPSPQTIQDFCQMVIQQDCGVIVMLNIANSQDQSMAIYWDGYVNYGDIQVVQKRRSIQKVLVVRQLEFKLHEKDGSGKVKDVTMIQFTAWLQDMPLPSIEAMLELLSETRKYMTKAPSKRLLVHCLNGSDQTGLFCVMYNLFEKIAVEEFVNVVSTVRKVTSRRPSAFQKLDQFKFCYSTLVNYLRSVTDYHTYAVTVKEIKDMPTVQDDSNEDENMYAIVAKVMKNKTEKMADGNDVYAVIKKTKKHAHFEDKTDTYIDMNHVKKDEDGDVDMYMSMSGKRKN